MPDDNPTATPYDDYGVSVVAHWDDGQTASASGSITVYDVMPTGGDDELSAVAGQVLTGNLLGNDIDVSADVLTIIGYETYLMHGTVTVAPNGDFIYDPGDYFNYLTGNETAEDYFWYFVVDDDNAAQANSPNVVITVGACQSTGQPSVTVEDATVDEMEAVSLEITTSGKNYRVSGTCQEPLLTMARAQKGGGHGKALCLFGS